MTEIIDRVPAAADRKRPASSEIKSERDYLLSYIDQLIGQYQISDGATSGLEGTGARNLIDAVGKKPSSQLTWDDAYNIEAALVEIETGESLRRKAWAIRAEYRDIVGQRQYEDYLKSAPPYPARGDVEDLRRDCQQLLRELHWLYTIIPVQEQARNKLSLRISAVTLGLCIVLALFYVVWMAKASSQSGEWGVPVIPVVAFCGAIGGAVSVQRRIQAMRTDGNPVANLLGTLRQLFISIDLAPVTGSIAAILLYLLFSAGLLQGSVFPKIADYRVTQMSQGILTLSATQPADAAPPAMQPLSYINFFQYAAPATLGDYAKLLIWAFIAGFAERLVPDTLDRLVAQTDQNDTPPKSPTSSP
jgi:hypothetical protein